MSIEGRARVNGSTVTRYRSANAFNADRTTNKTWTDVGTLGSLALTVRAVSAGLAQRLWGRETQAVYLCRAPAGIDIVPDDVLVVTAGPFVGLTLRVLTADPKNEGPAHLLLGLLGTPETVP